MRTSTMSWMEEFVHVRNFASSRSGAVWGAREASRGSRISEEILKTLRTEPISNPKAGNTLEMGYLTSAELRRGVAWHAGATWGTSAAGELRPAPGPAGAAWGCSVPDAAPMDGVHLWIH